MAFYKTYFKYIIIISCGLLINNLNHIRDFVNELNPLDPIPHPQDPPNHTSQTFQHLQSIVYALEILWACQIQGWAVRSIWNK